MPETLVPQEICEGCRNGAQVCHIISKLASPSKARTSPTTRGIRRSCKTLVFKGAIRIPSRSLRLRNFNLGEAELGLVEVEREPRCDQMVEHKFKKFEVLLKRLGVKQDIIQPFLDDAV